MTPPSRCLPALTAMVLFLAPFAASAQTDGNPPASPQAPAPTAAPSDPATRGIVRLDQPDAKIVPLFDGQDLSFFYTWLDYSGVYVDPDQVFTITNGWLRISGQHRGYLATKAHYSDYRLIAEFKWGEQRWNDKPRNSGLFIHGTGVDRLWMKSIECQIMEGGTGNVVLHGGAKLTVEGVTKGRAWSDFFRATEEEVELAHGEWNTMEVLCDGGIVRIRVNGHLTVDGAGAVQNQGRILLQSNGAEIFFRRVEMFPLPAASKAPAGATHVLGAP